MQKQEGPYPRQSSADRKEALYHDIIDYFDKGKVAAVYNVREDGGRRMEGGARGRWREEQGGGWREEQGGGGREEQGGGRRGGRGREEQGRRMEGEGGGWRGGRGMEGREEVEYVHAHNFLSQLWECGIEQCKEIASQLETVTFDYEKLSDIHVSGGNPLVG